MMFQKACGLAFTVALVTAIPQALPPGVENLPDCALNGLPAVLAASGCQGVDINCLCSKPDLAPQLDAAVNTACSDEADRKQIKDFVAGFCPTSSSSTTTVPSTTESSTTESAMPTTEMTTSEMPTSEMTTSEMTTTEIPTTEITTTEIPTIEIPTTTPLTTPTTMIMPSGGISPTMNSTNGTSPTYNSPSPIDTSAPISTGTASSYGVSVFAFVVAMGGMTWAFAEL